MRHWLPGKIHEEYYGYGDNEGILSTIPAVATATSRRPGGKLAAVGPLAGSKGHGIGSRRAL